MTSLARLAAATALVVTVALASVVTATPARADAPHYTTTSCNPDRYRTHYTFPSLVKRARVTHLRAFALPPTSGRSVRTTKRVRFQIRLAASVNLSSGSSVGGRIARAVIARVSNKMNVQFQGAGSYTTRRSITVTEYYRNDTRRNVQYVFFRGYLKGSGTWRRWYCYPKYDQYGHQTYRVAYDQGPWRSFGLQSDGAISCTGGSRGLNAVTRAAKSQGC